MSNNKNVFICLYSKLLVVIKQHSKYYQFMNYSFQYIDIILLAMIAGFIFLRLRGILGKKTGFEGKIPTQFEKEFQKIKVRPKPINENFDEEAQKEFLKGARIAYETIIIDFSDSDNKLIASKPLLDKKIHDQFKEALLDRDNKGHFAEITFIGIKSAVVKAHKKIEENLEVTVDFVSEIITCIKDKDKKVISGDSEKIKIVYDTWVFSKDMKSSNPNWLLIDTIT
jgi:predicted lipid-binding transport protein (Tim44 family)